MCSCHAEHKICTLSKEKATGKIYRKNIGTDEQGAKYCFLQVPLYNELYMEI